MAARTTIAKPAADTRAGDSNTPVLSPSLSAGPTPAFERLSTPDTSDVDGFVFDIGPPAAEVEIPECWGHRGVSVVLLYGSLFPRVYVDAFIP